MRTRAEPVAAGRRLLTRSVTVLLCAGLLMGANSDLMAKTSCHVHALVDARADVRSTPATIGPYDDRDACEQARRELFGPLGRCHCTAGFTPGWVVGSEPSGAPIPPGLPPGAAMP